MIIATIKREDFEDEPFKIAKIVMPFAMIGLNYLYPIIETVIEDLVSDSIMNYKMGDFIINAFFYILAALSIAFGGLLVYQGVKEIKILTINLGLLTVFTQILGIYSNIGDGNIFVFGILLVIFGVSIIFINWKMLSIKKSQHEQLNGGGADA